MFFQTQLNVERGWGGTLQVATSRKNRKNNGMNLRKPVQCNMNWL